MSAVLTEEIFLVQEFLALLTEREFANFDAYKFIICTEDILSKYMDQPDLNLPIIDQIADLIYSFKDKLFPEDFFTELKLLLFTFLKKHESQLGKILIMGSFHREDYSHVKEQFSESGLMVAFLQSFTPDDSHFSAWLIDSPHSFLNNNNQPWRN